MPPRYDFREPYNKRDPTRQSLLIKETAGKELKHMFSNSRLLDPNGGSQEPRTAPARVWCRGAAVRLQGMEHRKDLNGALGTVVADKPDEFGRIYVDVGKDRRERRTRVLKVLPERLQPEGQTPTGHDALDTLGASPWSSSGIRTGFPGFGVLNVKQWKSQPELADKLHQVSLVSHRSFARTVNGGFFPEPSAESV
mmetsp:Transcript_9218/g.21907  ORF Transcript_9218/g.21907 Transcript_9218/m.21907 type:complete len:196 (+) Transcript_9218:24-611(+)